MDTTTLRTIENFILFGKSVQRWPADSLPNTDGWDTVRDILALLAGLVYLIHFVAVWFYTLALYIYYRKRCRRERKVFMHPWNFYWVFGLVNLIAVITQMAWPTAPPWYVEQYGTGMFDIEFFLLLVRPHTC